MGDPKEALIFFTSLRKKFEDIHHTLSNVEQKWMEEDPRYPNELKGDEMYRHMTLDVGIAVQITYMEWCDRCIARIKAQQK